MSELKPCPFCGGDVETFFALGLYYFACQGECNLGFDIPANSLAIACDKWNSRHNDWIPCSDRMPEPCCDVTIYSTNDLIVQAHLEADDSRWFTDWDSRPWGLEEVTHWMPLPEPPKRITDNSRVTVTMGGNKERWKQLLKSSMP